MAKVVIHQLIDDLDGSEAEETVLFALDGVTYSIDLSAENAAKLRDALASFVVKAERVGRPGSRIKVQRHIVRTGVKAAEQEAQRNRNGQIRSWFEKLTSAQRAAIHPKHATELADRGRIPQAIIDEYDATSGGQVESKPEPGNVPQAAFQAPSEAPSESNGSKPLERMTRDELRQYARDHGMSSVTRLTSVPSLLAGIRKVEAGEAPVVKAAPRKRATKAVKATS